jgi:hypothetical protein
MQTCAELQAPVAIPQGKETVGHWIIDCEDHKDILGVVAKQPSQRHYRDFNPQLSTLQPANFLP